ETDAPFLAPVPFRGKRNEPSYILSTAQKVAEIKKFSFEKVAEVTTVNALRVFGMKEERL
ncbi:MAG: TatD family hydrolase, partial [Desulfobacterales bacterium]|nr:TatD family hydrolase [Desulfobacterales bacterium]